MKSHIIALLLFCCLAPVARAGEIQLQEGHPDRYVVVKGDALWGIAGKFLKDPWLWPQIWKMNREQIKNPNLIYPGDVVVLDVSNGAPQLRLLRETVTLEPGKVIEPLARKAVPTIAPNVILPFLSQPLVVEESELQEAPSIVASSGDHVVLGPGYKVYVDKIPQGSGLHWHIFREGRPLVDPDTKEALGIEAVYLGNAQVLSYGDASTGEAATIEITQSKEDIYRGDRLIKVPDSFISNFVPRAPEVAVNGRIMAGYGSIGEIGQNAIVSINRGKIDGLEQGHVLAVYRPGKILPAPKPTSDQQAKDSPPKPILLPEERVGLLMVFRTFDRVSYALAMKTEVPLHVLDVVKNP